MKTCLRCGSDFVRLDIHLKNKKICEANYLDIHPNDILDNYDKLLIKFNKAKKINGEGFKCEHCSKTFTYKSGLSRHKKCHKKCRKNSLLQQSIQNIDTQTATTINNINTLNGDNNTNNIQIVINNYSQETPLKVEDIKELLKNNSLEGMVSSVIKKIHIDMPENRNIYLKSEYSRFMDVFKNNKWNKEEKKAMLKNLYERTSKSLTKYLKVIKNDLINEQKLKENKRNAVNLSEDDDDDDNECTELKDPVEFLKAFIENHRLKNQPIEEVKTSNETKDEEEIEIIKHLKFIKDFEEYIANVARIKREYHRELSKIEGVLLSNKDLLCQSLI